MSPASRRIFFYWLLLLVPALVIGGVAIQLLGRERARIATQGDYAQDARRAAAVARARLVVENVELLVGDVQSALLDTLATEADEGLEEFLGQWEMNNPLVRTAFICRTDGELIRPRLDAPEEDARGFVRRFSSLLRENPPWAEVKDTSLDEKRSNPVGGQLRDHLARQEISSNVAQVQSARRDVQELAKTREYPTLKSRSSAPRASSAVAESDVAAAASATPKDTAAGKPAASFRESRGRVAADSSPSELAGPREIKESVVASAPGEVVLKERSSDLRGWTSLAKEGRFHSIGWVHRSGEEVVRGVELEMAALISRLSGALPVEVSEGEGYALRDDQGRVVHQIGAVPRTGNSLISVPLSQQSLPSWSVAAYLHPEYPNNVNGTGFFWAGALLVGLFVSAILAGGSLLLRQARRSELEALQKTSFVANVSHEFKTPLTTIRLYSELLEQGRVRDAKQGGDYLRTIGRETERLARLVNNALDFSRLEQGQKKYARERLDVVAEIKRLAETHALRVAEAGLALACSVPTEPIPVTTDRDAMEQILLNLVDNACKYAAAGGEIEVAVKAQAGAGVEISVSDRGSGVPADQHEKIFEKFHRVNDSLIAEKSGAGLGLSIARQLARGLGGDLRYRARAGGGAQFVFTLP